MKKSNIACFVAGALIFGSVGAFAGQYAASDNPFPIKLNGENVSIDGYNIDGSTYFKLRDIADTIGGFTVDFQDNTILLAKDGYIYAEKSENIGDYDEFERLFAEQEYILDDNYNSFVEQDNLDTKGLLNAIYDARTALLEKSYDLANLYLTSYNSSYAITMDELDALCEEKYQTIVEEDKKNNPENYTGGSLERVMNTYCYWKAAKEILKQYYYELYKYTGIVAIDLTVG